MIITNTGVNALLYFFIIVKQYILTAGMSSRKVEVYENEDEVVSKLCEKLQNAADQALVGDGIFKIGLSGGSLVKQLSKGLPTLNTDWSKWRFFFCDERVVPFDNADSTYGAYKKAFSGVIDISDDQFIKVNPDLETEDAAKDYIKKLSVYFPPNDIPRFDVLLLGMGPDGHTCSLFPGHPLLDETSVWVSPIENSPKPPPCRITLTFPVINQSQLDIFVAVGENKAGVVKEILKDNKPLPAGRVNPTNGEVIWLLDKSAASQL
ncbi:6-phosphogluconolactonase [Planococcus citri]|uniref:6-phosphogluconolactonase n=1 Tax=Planococcus citri TaxID=170843 RepID=UPI0031F7581F